MSKQSIKQLKKSKLSVSFIILFVIACNIATCQVTTPFMWVAKNTAIAEEQNFKTGPNNKFAVLSSIIGGPETDSIFYPLASFQSMLSKMQALNPLTLRVYIATYDARAGNVPPGLNKHLMMIFAPVIDTPMGYYTIDPAGNIDTLDASVKDRWLYYHDSLKMKGLVSTLADTTNVDNQRNGKASDTYSIGYKWTNIYDYFVNQVSYQTNTNHVNVSGVVAKFAAYGSSGDPDTTNPMLTHHFKNRLLIQWELTKQGPSGTNPIFYIDDLPPFVNGKLPKKLAEALNARKLASRANGGKSGNTGKDKADNGNLCPPTCP